MASPFPQWLEPMAATLTQERFDGPEWTFEHKVDGIRLLAFKEGSEVRLYSRTRHRQTLPHIAEAIAALSRLSSAVNRVEGESASTRRAGVRAVHGDPRGC